MRITSLICRAFEKPLRHAALQNSYPKKKKTQATNIHNNTGVLCSTFRTFRLYGGIEGKNIYGNWIEKEWRKKSETKIHESFCGTSKNVCAKAAMKVGSRRHRFLSRNIFIHLFPKTQLILKTPLFSCRERTGAKRLLGKRLDRGLTRYWGTHSTHINFKSKYN